MDKSGSKRGKGGRRALVNSIQKEKNGFRWNKDDFVNMAHYVHDHYDKYKTAIQSNQKINFLRKMRDSLNLDCDDTQLKNGFARFLKKYDDVRIKLNSSGFGVDPEKDQTLDLESGWIKTNCPYFNILDEVMGSRPNVRPPFVAFSSGVGPIGSEHSENHDVRQDEDLSQADDTGLQTTIEEDMEMNEELYDGRMRGENIDSRMEENNSSASTGFIKAAFNGLGVRKSISKPGSRSALGAFGKIMNEKISKQAEVDKQRLDFDKEKHESAKLTDDKRFEIELLKVETQKETDMLRLQHEKDLAAQNIQENKEIRQHELIKIEKQEAFELRKLELQIELEKIKSGNQSIN